jgi:hypothetical protein
MVYLAKKNGAVVAHADQQARLEMDGVSPEKTVSDQEWEAAEGIARIIDGAIFLGKTDAEKAKEAAGQRIVEIDYALAALDQKTIRSSRDIAWADHNGQTPDPDDVAYLTKYEADIAALKVEREAKKALLV